MTVIIFYTASYSALSRMTTVPYCRSTLRQRATFTLFFPIIAIDNALHPDKFGPPLVFPSEQSWANIAKKRHGYAHVDLSCTSRNNEIRTVDFAAEQ